MIMSVMGCQEEGGKGKEGGDLEDLKHVMELISEEEQWRLKLAGEKGASSWLTVLPIREFGFALHKGHFIGCYYGWEHSITLHWNGCGTCLFSSPNLGLA